MVLTAQAGPGRYPNRREYAKNLSVNRKSLSPTDHCAGECEKRNVAGLCLFEADQQFAEPIEP